MPDTTLPLGPFVADHPAQRPASVTRSGRFGSIVKLDPDTHGPILWQALQNDEAIWTYMRVGPFATEQAFIASLRAREATPDAVTYAILDVKQNAVGMFWLMAIRPEMRVCEVGNVVYSKLLQKTALGTEAQFLLMQYVFDVLGYRRYEWKTNALNAGSRRAALRYGFSFEGIFRQNEIIKGRNRDTAWYALLDHEWPKVKQAFQLWLEPDNFDNGGVQKNALKI